MTPLRKPVVYLIAQPTVSRRKKPPDLNGLYTHGEVQVLCPTGDSPTFVPTKCITAMGNRLENFDPDIDFLVWAGGDTLSAVFAGMLLVERDIWSFNWLRFERERQEDGSRAEHGSYVPVRIDLSDPEEEPPYAQEDDARNMTGDLERERV